MPAPARGSIVLLSSSEEESGGGGEGIKEVLTGTASKSKNASGGKMAKENKRKWKVDESRSPRAIVPSSSCSSTPVWKSNGVMNSSCSFPMSRVRRLVAGSEGERRGSGIRPSHEAVFLVNKAAELFLELFAEDAYACAKNKRNKSLSYDHLTSNVHTKKKYEFLSDFVPEKIKADDAMKARELSHNE